MVDRGVLEGCESEGREKSGCHLRGLERNTRIHEVGKWQKRNMPGSFNESFWLCFF